MENLKLLREAKASGNEVTIAVGFRCISGLSESLTLRGKVTDIWSVPGHGYTIELSGERAFRLSQISIITE